MLIRVIRDDDWETCLDVDLSYETDFAWQMDEHQGGGEWQVNFREIRLPRKLRIRQDPPSDGVIKSWEQRDRFWVAIQQREVIGYISVEVDPARNQAEIKDLAVVPEHRRKGVATELLQRAMEWSFRQRLDQLVFICPLRAFPAISFALKHRFIFCGYQDAYWPGQEVALFFRQRIR